MSMKKTKQESESWSLFVSEGKAAGRNKDLRLSSENFQNAYEASRTFSVGDSRRAESAYYLAYTRYLQKQYEEAIELFEEALKHFKSDKTKQQKCAQIYSLLASMWFELRRLDLVEENVKKSLQIETQLSTESWENIQMLASVLVTLRRYEQAVPVLEKLISYQKRLLPQEVANTKEILAHVQKQIAEDEHPPSVRSIVEHENRVAKELFPKVKEDLFLLGDTYTFSGQVLEIAYPEKNPTLAKQVCTKLVLRMINDLRSISMLAEVGYDVQANSLAASVYECAFTIGTIYDDRELAKKWIEHEDPKKAFLDAYLLTKTAWSNYGSKQDMTDSSYKIYRQLCWGKHLNPISEQQGGIEKVGNTIEYLPGPRSDELTERGISFCCSYTVFFALFGIEMFARKHVSANKQAELVQPIKELHERRANLFLKSQKRWGSEDPFPGKW